MPQAVGAVNRDVTWSEARLQGMHEGEGIGDEAATDMEVGHDLGEGVYGSPDKGALLVTANVGHQFVELQE